MNKKNILVSANDIGNDAYILISNGYDVEATNLCEYKYIKQKFNHKNYPHAVYINTNPEKFIDRIKMCRSLSYLYSLGSHIVYAQGIKYPKAIKDCVTSLVLVYEYDYKSAMKSDEVAYDYEYYDKNVVVLKYDERNSFNEIALALHICNGIVFVQPRLECNIDSKKTPESRMLYNTIKNASSLVYTLSLYTCDVENEEDEVSLTPQPYLIYAENPYDQDDVVPVSMIYACSKKDLDAYFNRFILTQERCPDPDIFIDQDYDYKIVKLNHSELLQKDFDYAIELV